MYLLTTRKFNYTRVDFYVEDENSTEFWITRQQIGELLGWYNASAERQVKKLHHMFNNQLVLSFKEIEINVRYQRICKTIVYNFDGLTKLCILSEKKKAAEVLNFFWQMKQEFEGKVQQNLPAVKNELQLFNYGDNPVRAIEQNGEFWFVAKDVCDILGLANVTNAIKSLADDEKMTLTESKGQKNRGGAQFYNVINEPGLYRLVFKSNKPEAEKFKHWVFHDVLPSLRDTGTYTIGVKPRQMLTGKATDTRFYSADELAAELNTDENTVIRIVFDNEFDIYGFVDTDECLWYFTEEGRQKIIKSYRSISHAQRL